MDQAALALLLGPIRVLFWFLAGITALEFIRARDRTRLEVALLFYCAAVVITVLSLRSTHNIRSWTQSAAIAVAVHPYLFLRMVRHVGRVPTWISRGTLAGSILFAVLMAPAGEALSANLIISFLVFFVAAEGYASARFIGSMKTGRGVTRWRAVLMAVGAGAMGLVIVMAGLDALFPPVEPYLVIPALALGYLSPVAFYFGIAPPRWLRRVWRRVELDRFLGELLAETGNPGPERIAELLRASALAATGGQLGAIARWVPGTERHLLSPFAPAAGDPVPDPTQIPIDLGSPPTAAIPADRLDPAAGLQSHGGLVLLAPIAHERWLWGHLLVALESAPLFIRDELELLGLMGAQAGLAIRSAHLLAAARNEIAARLEVEEILQAAQASLERQVAERTAALWEISIRDATTGVFNRRYLQDRLETEIARAEAGGTSIGIIMADIDDFKQFNDAYGHTAGDDLLRMAAGMLQSRLRKQDIICRFGGDEFILVLAGATRTEAAGRAAQLRSILLQGMAEQGFEVTVSMGVAAFPENGSQGGEVVTRADHALLKAKQTGKNRVETAPAGAGG